jgi:hypothetical protein
MTVIKGRKLLLVELCFLHNNNVKESIINLKRREVFLLTSVHYILSVCSICVHEEWLNKIAPTLAHEVQEVKL